MNKVQIMTIADYYLVFIKLSFISVPKDKPVMFLVAINKYMYIFWA